MMEILLLLVLVRLNGLFAMSDIALVAARKSRLLQLIQSPFTTLKIDQRFVHRMLDIQRLYGDAIITIQWREL